MEASFRASAAGSDTSEVNIGIVNAWARLSTTGSVTMELDSPSADGNIVSGRADVIAATNAPSGYDLYLSANDTLDGSSASLTNAYTSTRITPISASSTSKLSTVNTWGYAVKGSDSLAFKDAGGTTLFEDSYTDGGSFKDKLFKGALPAAQSSNGLIASAAGPRSGGAITNVFYAAYVSTATPSGTYGANITYTLVADFVSTVDPNEPTPENPDPNNPNQPSDDDKYAATSGGNKHYFGNGAGNYYHYDDEGNKTVSALGVNKTEDGVATIANINDGSITWAAIAIIAGASATFLAIALLRDREDEDEEE